VYLELLPEEAVSVIGKPHDEAAPAKRLLEKEGFTFNGTIDIFDAGPVMECRRENIASMTNSREVKIAAVTEAALTKEDSDALCMVSNGELSNYRLTLTPVKLQSVDAVILPQSAATLIEVEVGNRVRVLEIMAGSNGK
jgi:arginine N-succinyltransferase